MAKQLTSTIQGLTNQGKLALLLGSVIFVSTDVMTGRIRKDPLSSAFAIGLVVLTTFNIECLARPVACPNWAWFNVAALGLNLLALYTLRRK